MPGTEFPGDGYFLSTAYLLEQHMSFASWRPGIKKMTFCEFNMRGFCPESSFPWRRDLRGGLPRLAAVLFFVLFGVAGCARLPQAIPVPEDERVAVAQAFASMLARQVQCHACLDARVTVKLESLLQKGTLDGYLQLKSPAYLKFVGINPLGQPLLFLATDGAMFKYVAVMERKNYEGSVAAKAFVKYTPQGFDPAQGFSWLTGCLSPPGLEVVSVTRDETGLGYWLEIKDAGGGDYRRVLFDLDRQKILQQTVSGESGKTEMVVAYDEFQELPTSPGCFLPGRVEVNSDKHNGASLLVFYSEWQAESTCDEKIFTVPSPAGFENILVK